MFQIVGEKGAKMIDPIDRQAAIDAIDKYYEEKRYIKRTRTILSAICLDMKSVIQELPSVQPEDWMERNKERILQAGREGREIEFRIGGRLFAIREKAQ